MKKNRNSSCSEIVFTRLFYMTFFALAFMLMGQVIPEIYFNYFDKKVYYEIKSATVTEDVYMVGDKVTISFDRVSRITTKAEVYIELVLENEQGQVEVYNILRPLALNSNPPEQTILAEIILPKMLEEGEYFIRGIVYYSNNRVDKIAEFETNKFVVKK